MLNAAAAATATASAGTDDTQNLSDDSISNEFRIMLYSGSVPFPLRTSVSSRPFMTGWAETQSNKAVHCRVLTGAGFRWGELGWGPLVLGQDVAMWVHHAI